jgi:hypothetical protein
MPPIANSGWAGGELLHRARDALFDAGLAVSALIISHPLVQFVDEFLPLAGRARQTRLMRAAADGDRRWPRPHRCSDREDVPDACDRSCRRREAARGGAAGRRRRSGRGVAAHPVVRRAARPARRCAWASSALRQPLPLGATSRSWCAGTNRGLPGGGAHAYRRVGNRWRCKERV